MPRGTGTGPDNPDYGIAAVERTFDVVAAIMRLGPSTLASIAAEADCNRATTFRILHTLQSRGLATQDGPRGLWRLGTAWLTVARTTRQQHAMERAAAPFMTALARACRETMYLSVRDGQESEMIAVHPGDKQIRVYAKPGDRSPLHAGSGRLLLAYAPAPIQSAVLTSRLSRLTPSVRIDAPWIAADLQRIRNRGWLITHDEIEEGAVTISTPVRDNAGNVIAALTIASPSIRMRPPRPHTLLATLLDTAMALGAVIGKLP
jgi:IclR family transcriptional regulator, KDG regulon repressor